MRFAARAWLVGQAKLNDLQNRLGFVVTLARELAERQDTERAAQVLSGRFSLKSIAKLTQRVDLPCLGGFVVADRYNISRTTADLDVFQTANQTSRSLTALAGRGTPLHKTYKVYLDVVAMAVVPDDYETRLTELHPRTFEHLHLWALEVHDIVLAKLTRNIDRDREDVQRLARHPGLDRVLLEQRYREELRHHVSRPDREDLTLQLWLEMIAQVQARAQRGS